MHTTASNNGTTLTRFHGAMFNEVQLRELSQNPMPYIVRNLENSTSFSTTMITDERGHKLIKEMVFASSDWKQSKGLSHS